MFFRDFILKGINAPELETLPRTDETSREKTMENTEPALSQDNGKDAVNNENKTTDVASNAPVRSEAMDIEENEKVSAALTEIVEDKQN
jgi:hypothetical protein